MMTDQVKREKINGWFSRIIWAATKTSLYGKKNKDFVFENGNVNMIFLHAILNLQP